MLLDIGVGIILSLAVSKLFALQPATLFILGGIAFALLPDIDAIAEILKYKSLGGYEARIHREWVHYPFLYAVVAAVVYLLWGAAWAVLLLFCVFAHFLHDSVGLGWGIKWFGPFSKNNYKFFSDPDGTLSKRLVMRWTPAELAEALKKHHNPNWFRDFYLRLSFINVSEFLMFIVAVVILWVLVYR